MIEIHNLEQTCGACPSQWEFTTFENRMVYVRYRWGYLSVRIGEPNGDLSSAVRGKEVIGEQIGGEFSGVITWEEVLKRLSKLEPALLLRCKL